MLFMIPGFVIGVTRASADDYVVHEWGTFTSVQGSNGLVLEGLHHEEVELPSFVHGLTDHHDLSLAQSLGATDVCDHGCKVCCNDLPQEISSFSGRSIPSGVTQKLETPVLYFYSKLARQVRVHVDFPEGLFAQWFPQVESLMPNTRPFQQLAGGALGWKIDVLAPNERASIPAVASDSIWAPSRNVHANFVRSGNENEKLLFYRGLGHFSIPVTVSDSGSGSIVIKNDTAYEIPNVFVLSTDGVRGIVTAIGAIDRGHEKTVNLPSISPSSLGMNDYLSLSRIKLKGALTSTGLYSDEAQAMVDTWSKSYFRTKGVRVLYIVPRELTDGLLPIAIDPQPRELVRTLVGRIEVMTRDEEQNILSHVDQIGSLDLGRFAEPKFRRVLQLTRDSALQKRLQNKIETLNGASP